MATARDKIAEFFEGDEDAADYFLGWLSANGYRVTPLQETVEGDEEALPDAARGLEAPDGAVIFPIGIFRRRK